jgi:hypothetical protein
MKPSPDKEGDAGGRLLLLEPPVPAMVLLAKLATLAPAAPPVVYLAPAAPVPAAHTAMVGALAAVRL